MADTKISALPSATTPLAGTELLPVVQAGATKNVPASAFQAALVPGTNIKTINGNSLLGSGDLPISGGSGSPGGSTTQVQFNDSGAFGGDAGLAFDKTTGRLTVGGKTVTASAPVLDMSQSWNAGAVTFTGIKFNVASDVSAAGSLLMDLQVGGASRFNVDKTGAINVRNSAVNSTVATFSSSPSYTQNYGPTIAFQNGTGELLAGLKGAFTGSNQGGNGYLAFFTRLSDAAGITEKMRITHDGKVGIGLTVPQYALDISGALRTSADIVSGSAYYFSNNFDLVIARDNPNTLAQRNGANGQTFRLYGNYATASDFRRLKMAMSLAGVAEIKPEDGGTYAGSTVLYISGLPTSNPGPGILWNNGGVVNVGT